MTQTAWANCGDVNHKQYGGFFIRQDDDTTFEIVETYPNPDTEDDYGDPASWFVFTGYVDVTDDWIDHESVSSYSGVLWDELDNGGKAEITFRYYGAIECGGDETEVTNYEEALANLGIPAN